MSNTLLAVTLSFLTVFTGLFSTTEATEQTEDPVVLTAPVLPEHEGLAIAAGQYEEGELVVQVAGASAGEHVWLLLGYETGHDHCSGNFAPSCEGILDYEVVERTVADEAGRVTFRVTPQHEGREVYVQAGILRNEDASMLTTVLETRVH